ncbi:hypothetical protein LCGC14_1969740 [marine sediment metagenome]|uniref:Uncharacterized protein n=1 Tax=marine sediment metagenome TaxID=412755 RepID=A0A0F9HQG9_9ZZZZ
MAAIDIGQEAIDRTGVTSVDARTLVVKANPANGTGTVSQVEIWLQAASSNDVWFGTFSAAGDVLTCRDSESVGNVPAGSKQTFSGLDIDVVAGHYLGTHAKTSVASIEKDSGSAIGVWGFLGEAIDPSDSETFIINTDWRISLFGTGEALAIGTKSANMAAKMMAGRAI